MAHLFLQDYIFTLDRTYLNKVLLIIRNLLVKFPKQETEMERVSKIIKHFVSKCEWERGEVKKEVAADSNSLSLSLSLSLSSLSLSLNIPKNRH